jgi:hypothetical protein
MSCADDSFMGTAELAQIQCPDCGKRFTWSQRIAGRNVRCPCGKVFICPECALAPEESYDLAPDPDPKAARAQEIAPPVQTLAYAGRQPGKKPEPTDVETVKEIYAPAWILAGGLVVLVGSEVFEWHRDLHYVLIDLAIQIVGGSFLMLGGVAIASRMRGVKIGRLHIAILKLGAISVAPSAALSLVTPIVLFIPFAGLICVIASFFLYFALLGVFFDLEEGDTWVCVLMIFLINIGLQALIAWRWG